MMRLRIIILMFIWGCALFSRQVVPVRELMKPESIRIDSSQIYIVEDASVFIYSKKDFKLIKKFGKKGEGPREFKISDSTIERLRLNVQTDRLLANHMGKLSIFTKRGEFIKEFKCNLLEGRYYKPLGDHYVGYGFTQEDKIVYVTLNLFDSRLTKKKEVFRQRNFFQAGSDVRPFAVSFSYHTNKDKLYVAGTEAFLIDVFDENGTKLFSIVQKYNRIKVTAENKREVHKYYKNHRFYKQYYEAYKDKIIFPDYFPALRDFRITGDKIYVRTYKREPDNTEFYILDMQGKLLKKVIAPFRYSTVFSSYPFAIYEGRVYQLIENEDSEEWELHITDIG